MVKCCGDAQGGKALLVQGLQSWPKSQVRAGACLGPNLTLSRLWRRIIQCAGTALLQQHHSSMRQRLTLSSLTPLSGRICCLCQALQDCKELRRLADEQPVGRQGTQSAHGSPLGRGRANDRNDRERAAEEDGGLGHDQVGLEVLSAKRRGIEVRKHQPIRGVGQSRRIACLVVPGLKMHCLGWADTEQDAQHFWIGDSLGQRGVEARATLLAESKIEYHCVGCSAECVKGGWVISRFKALQVSIGSGNGRKLPFTQPRDCLSKRVTEIGGLCAAAVPPPPTGVHGELHEVGEPSDLLRAGRFTAPPRAKLLQTYGRRALGHQVAVDEREVGELILGIVVDILGHVSIQHFQGSDVAWTPTPPWDFAVLDASQLVVLLP